MATDLASFRANCLLPDVENEFVGSLGVYCERPLPRELVLLDAERVSVGSVVAEPQLETEIENIQQFYNWLDTLKDQASDEVEGQLE